MKACGNVLLHLQSLADARIRHLAGNIGDALSVGDGEYGFKSLLRHVCHAATKPIGSRAVGANDAQVAAKLNKHHVHTGRSEEHTSELQSLMRISYAVFCLEKKKKQ